MALGLSLGSFIALLVTTLAAFFVSRNALKAGRQCSIGQPEENLTRMRGLYRRAAVAGALCVVAGGLAIWCGFSEAPQWRQTTEGRYTLTALAVLLALAFVQSIAKAFRYQWSPRRSTAALWRETVRGMVIGVLAGVALYWLGG